MSELSKGRLAKEQREMRRAKKAGLDIGHIGASDLATRAARGVITAVDYAAKSERGHKATMDSSPSRSIFMPMRGGPGETYSSLRLFPPAERPTCGCKVSFFGDVDDLAENEAREEIGSGG